jgi:hypothetical protein
MRLTRASVRQCPEPEIKVSASLADGGSVSRPLAVLVVVLSWLPLAALAALGGVLLGWQVPPLFAVVIAILITPA